MSPDEQFKTIMAKWLLRQAINYCWQDVMATFEETQVREDYGFVYIGNDADIDKWKNTRIADNPWPGL